MFLNDFISIVGSIVNRNTHSAVSPDVSSKIAKAVGVYSGLNRGLNSGPNGWLYSGLENILAFRAGLRTSLSGCAF